MLKRMKDINSSPCTLKLIPYIGVSRISFRGGGGFKIFLEKWGYLHGEATRLPGGVRGHAPPRIFLKNGAIWCVLENILQKFCKKKIIKKIVIFYMKIINNVLLRTIFRGIGAYCLDFLSLVRFGVFWSTVSVNCLNFLF